MSLSEIYSVGDIIKGGQYGTLKCLSIDVSDDDWHNHYGEYELLEDYTIWVDGEERIMYPKDTILRLSGLQYFGEKELS